MPRYQLKKRCQAFGELFTQLFPQRAKLVGLLPKEESEQQTQWLGTRMGEILSPLTYQQREVVKMTVGFGDGYEYTLEEIGGILRVSEAEVLQVKARAHDLLRASPYQEQLLQVLMALRKKP